MTPEGIVLVAFATGSSGLFKATGAPFYTLTTISGWPLKASTVGSFAPPVALANYSNLSVIAFARTEGGMAVTQVSSLFSGLLPATSRHATEILHPSGGMYLLNPIGRASSLTCFF